MKSTFTRLVAGALAAAAIVVIALVVLDQGGGGGGDGLEFVYVSPDPIGVNPFLAMGETGLRASGGKHGAAVTVIESDSPRSRLENVSAAVNDGADIVVVLGFEFNGIIADVAPTAPDTQFLVIDDCLDPRPENVSCARFLEHEPSYLMGVIAGLNTESGRIGAVSAIDIPLLRRFVDAFGAGARHVNPGVSYEIRWVGGQHPFQDPVRAKELALALASTGVDTVFAVTAGGDHGIFEAAREEGFKVLAVDVNQCPAAPDHILDGTLKRVDAAIVTAIDRLVAGERSFLSIHGLANGGMGTHASSDDATLEASGCLVAGRPGIVGKVREIHDQIVGGALVVEDPMASN